GFALTPIATVPWTKTSWVDTTAQPNTTYVYWVRARRDDSTYDDYSLGSSSATLLTYSAPPTSFTANAIGKTVYMTWNHTKQCAGYKIYEKSTGMFLLWTVVKTITNNNTLSTSITVPDYRAHTYKVMAYNASGVSTSGVTKIAYALAPPTGLTATALSSTSIRLDWDHPVDSNAVQIVASESTDGSSFSGIGAFTATASNLTVSSLSPETQYWFLIKVRNGSNESTSSNVTNTTTPAAGTAPAAPTSLLLAAASCNEISLNWTDNADNEENYIIERKEAGGTYSAIETSLAPDTESYSDTSVSAETTYYYRVKATNSIGDSAYSNETTITTPVCGTVPSAPIGLSATAESSSEISLTWTDNSDNEDGFKIERKEAGGTFAEIDTALADATTYSDTTVSPETTYYYRIRAYNTIGDSVYSDEAHATTPAAGTAPAAPTSLLLAAASCNEISLNWTDNADNEENYIIERKEAGGTYSAIETSLAPDTESYSDTSVSAETTYYYRVKATNSIGDSAYSNETTITTPVCGTVPSAPIGLSATAESSSEISLTWTDNSDNEDGFKIERKEAGGTYSVLATVGTDITSYDNIFLLPNTTYYYRVRAYSSLGFSDYSNEVSATTPPKIEQIIIRLYIDNPNMYINEVEQEIDPGRGTKPVIITEWSRTVVPIRAIVEGLGGAISWDGTARKVTINFKSTIIELWIDNPKAKVNGTGEWIDNDNHNVKPIIINDRTMLPIRFVTENLGCLVEWEGVRREIKITYPKP
ncbi:MAG: fibronectin type III domain-containing protein, partial [Caldisericota bacterium]|nr:fibronectin type III domain-containing protein [Caldisericota bacterium]